MHNRILTAEAAQRLQDESDWDRELLTWLVMEAEDSSELIARPVASGRGACYAYSWLARSRNCALSRMS